MTYGNPEDDVSHLSELIPTPKIFWYGGFPHPSATTTMADSAGSPAVACALAGSRQSETEAGPPK